MGGSTGSPNPLILSLSKDAARSQIMAFYVYILRCADGSYYTGHTDNLEQRLAAHQNGEIEGHTRTRRPVTLVFSDRFDSRQDAFERERQLKGFQAGAFRHVCERSVASRRMVPRQLNLKGWSRAKKEALIDNDWDRLVTLSRSRGKPR